MKSKLFPKNKKGEGETGSRGGAIIAAIVAVFILLIVFLGYAGVWNNILDKWGILIPGFNTNNTAADSIEILGYDIFSNSIKYYDGQSWVESPTDIFSLGRKKVSKNTAQLQLSNYYLTRKTNFSQRIHLDLEESKEIFSKEFEEEIIKETDRTLPGTFDAVMFKIERDPSSGFEDFSERGNIIALIISKIGFDHGDNTRYAEISLDSEDKMRIIKIKTDLSVIDNEVEEIPSSYSVYKNLASKMIEWRDSILKTPINLTYSNENNQEKTKSFCVKKINNLLIVNLAEPTTNSQCPIN